MIKLPLFDEVSGFRSKRSFWLAFGTALLFAGGPATQVKGNELYWDANGAVPGLGDSGRWDLEALRWNDASGVGEPVAWSGVADSVAVFAGVPGTVTVSAVGIAVNELRFATSGYDLAGEEGTNLFLLGPEPKIEVEGGIASVSSALILGGDGVQVSGEGALWLKRPMSLNGGVRVRGGTFRLGVTAEGDSDPRTFIAGNPLELSDGHLEIYASSSVNSNVSTGRITVRGDSSVTTVRTATGDPLPILTSLAVAGGVEMDGRLTWNVAGNTLDTNTNTNLGLTLGPVTLVGPSEFVVTGNGVRNTYAFIGAVQEIDGPQPLTKSGGGSLRFNGTNTNAGSTIITEGDVYLTATANLSPLSAVVISPELGKTARLNLSINGPHVETIGSLASGGEGVASVSLGSSSLTVGQDGSDTSFTGVISGAGGSLTKVGGGTLTLNTANTFSGGFTLLDGTVRVTTISAVGTTASPPSPRVFLRQGTLRAELAGSVLSTANRGFEVGPVGAAGSVTISVDSLNQLAIGGGVTDAPGGSGRIIKRGPGTLRFQDTACTFSGGMEILEGVFSVGLDSRIGAVPSVPTPGSIVIHGGTFLATASFTINAARGIALGPDTGSGSGTFSVTAGNTLTYGGTLANHGGGRGTLVKTGAGTLRLINVPNAFTGGIVVHEGDVSVALDSRLGAVPAQATPSSIVLNGGALTTTATFVLNANRGIAVGPEEGAGAGAINVTAGTLSYDGIITDNGVGSGAVLKTGNGVLRLTSGENTFTGGFELLGGSVIVEGGAGSLGIGEVRFGVDSVMQLVNWDAASGVERPFAIATGVTASIETSVFNSNFTLLGEISGDGILAKTGQGYLRLAQANTHLGGTQVLGGTLEVAPVAGSATGPGPVRVGATAVLSGAGTVAGAVTIEGIGGLPAILRPGGQGVLTGRPRLSLTGGLVLGAESVVELRVSPYGYGRLAVNEIMSVASEFRLVVVLEPSFLPEPGSAYPLVEVGDLPLGVSLTDYLALPSGINWDVSAFNATGVLRVAGATQPLAVTAPPSVIAAPGEQVTLSVSATGSGPYLIRWFKGDELISGAEGPDLILNAVTAGDSGDYRAEVSNGAETVLSDPGVLLVTLVPIITGQPQAQSVVAGQTATFTVTAVGPGVVGYDWRRNGVSLGAPNSSTLTLSSVGLNQAGTYSVRVFNGNGAVFSDDVVLVVNQAPIIVAGPQRRAANTGETVTFMVTATGTPTLLYQWQLEGVDLPDEQGATLEVVAGVERFGAYRVVVTNDFGSVTSEPALLSPLRAGDPQQVPEWDYAGSLPTAQIGLAYSFTPRVKADDPTAGVFRAAEVFSARGLPAGLVMDAATGEVNGTPTVFRAAPYPVVLRATNGFGAVELRTQIMVSGLPTAFTGVYAGPLERGSLLSGVVGDTNGPLGGRVDVTVTPQGAVSGRLTVGAKAFAYRGRVQVDPDDLSRAQMRVEIMQRRAVVFVLEGRLNSQTGEIENGTVTDGTSTSGFVAWRNPWSRTNRADAVAGYYTTRLDLADETLTSAEAPIGSGFLSFTVNPTTGRLTLVGRLADGTAVTVASFVGPSGQVAVFRTLYAATARGSLLGEMGINLGATNESNVVEGDLTWSRPANPARSNRLYRLGFPNVLEVAVAGGRYLPPTGDEPRVMGLREAANRIELTFTGVDLATAQPLSAAMVGAVDERNRVAFEADPAVNTRRVLLSITPRTGAIKGRFVLSESNPLLLPEVVRNVVRTVAYQGLIVGAEGAGFFVLPQLPAVEGETPANTAQEGGRVSIKPLP
jgi:autotransporter-associated beta strand protein